MCYCDASFKFSLFLRYPDWPYFLVKLLIPSVSGYHDHPEKYLYTRITALYAHIINMHSVWAKNNHQFNWIDEELSQTWGRFNRANAKDYEKQLEKMVCE